MDIIELEGRIGLNFFPPFVTTAPHATAEQLLPHIEYICELGGAKYIMMGSDFDGINKYLGGLENGAGYAHLTELLLRHYHEDLVKGFLYDNAYQFLNVWLPD
ncbi:Membrane dipeptidase [compost metagenome]